MAELCLMASHGYPPWLAFHPEQGTCRASKDCQPLLASPGARQELKRPSLNLRPVQREETWKPLSGLPESDHFVKIDQTISRPVLIDVQDTLPDSVLFSIAIAEQCTRHEKILQFLMSGSSEVEKGGLDLSLLSDLMGFQSLSTGMQQQPADPGFWSCYQDTEAQPCLIYPSSELYAQKPFVDFVGDLAHSSKLTVHPQQQPADPGLCSCYQDTEAQPCLIYPSSELYAQKPFVDFVGDLACSSKLTVHPDGQVSFMGTGTEMKDLLSVVAEFYLSKNSTKHGKQSLLVPHFTRLERADTKESFLKVETVVAPLKSPEKTKLKPSPKKKNGRKGCRERDLYKKNYFHACESLLSLMMNKRQQRKTAFLSLKKCGPELPELLTQFSAGIAGTGLAVLFSVVCKVACGRVPFCASKFLSTGLGFGLVWLSWAVNILRDTIVHISKNSGKLGLKEEEMMKRVDRSVNEIFFRAATLMALAVLRLA